MGQKSKSIGSDWNVGDIVTLRSKPPDPDEAFIQLTAWEAEWRANNIPAYGTRLLIYKRGTRFHGRNLKQISSFWKPSMPQRKTTYFLAVDLSNNKSYEIFPNDYILGGEWIRLVKL